MAMETWDPFQEMMTLRDAMNQLFQDSIVRPGNAMVPSGRGTLPLDIAETDPAFEVQATLPGIEPEDVQITVQGNMLSIRGQSTMEEERKNQNWITRERRTGTFARTVTLPVPVNADAAKVEFENGILKLTLPKKEEARAKQIRVPSAIQISSGTSENKSGTTIQG